MKLMIDGKPRDFIPVKTFRAVAGLSPEFGIDLFMPKDYSGLGTIGDAGAALQTVRDAVLEAVPRKQPPQGWLASTLTLQIEFRKALIAANDWIGLRTSEIDFAVMGFGEVCQAFVYTLLQAQMKHQLPSSFSEVYHQWLNSTIAISRACYFHSPEDQPWRIQLVRTAYGRCGLIVHTNYETHYVYDPAHHCPAEHFMVSLLSDVAACFTTAMKQPSVTPSIIE